MKLLSLLAVAGCAALVPSKEAPEPLAWKKKVYHRATSTLSFKKGKRSSLLFDLGVVNGLNNESCDFAGVAEPVVVDSEYLWKDADAGCSIDFQFLPEEVELRFSPDCQAYCGLGTSLPTQFYERTPACAPKKIEERRLAIKKLHHKGIYLGAADAFSNLLANCGDFMDLALESSIIHDKAYAFWKYGDSKACRETLEPLAHWVGREEDTSHNELPEIKRVRKELTYTWKLCHLEK